MMKTAADYERAREIIHAAFAAWDPFGLFQIGAPPNEYHPEEVRVLVLLFTVSTAQELTRVIAAVFRTMFGYSSFTPERCSKVSENIFAALKVGNLLTTPDKLAERMDSDLGIPANDFEGEVARVMTGLRGQGTLQDLARAIGEIFRDRFSDLWFTPEWCERIAKTLFGMLGAQGILFAPASPEVDGASDGPPP